MQLGQCRYVLKPPDLKTFDHVEHYTWHDRLVQVQVTGLSSSSFWFLGKVPDVHQFVVKLIAVTSLNRIW